MPLSDNLTITSIIDKESSSASVVLKGLYLNHNFHHEHVFVKVYHETEFGLRYETDVYNRIHFVSSKDLNHNLLRNHIIMPPFESKRLYSFSQIMQCVPYINTSLSKKLEEQILGLNRGKEGMFGITITYNYENRSVNELLMLLLDNIDSHNVDSFKRIIVDTLFEVIYCVYILNEYFGVIHNDCHFGNFRVNFTPNRKVTYLINKHTFTRNSVLNVRLYDFDWSYMLIGENNPTLNDDVCKTLGRCNYKTTKDSDILYLSIIKYYITIDEKIRSIKQKNESKKENKLELVAELEDIKDQLKETSVKDNKDEYWSLKNKKIKLEGEISRLSKNVDEYELSPFESIRNLILQIIGVFSLNNSLLKASIYNLENEKTTGIFWNTKCEVDKSTNRFIPTSCEGKNEVGFSSSDILYRYISKFFPEVETSKFSPEVETSKFSPEKENNTKPKKYAEKYTKSKTFYTELRRFVE